MLIKNHKETLSNTVKVIKLPMKSEDGFIHSNLIYAYTHVQHIYICCCQLSGLYMLVFPNILPFRSYLLMISELQSLKAMQVTSEGQILILNNLRTEPHLVYFLDWPQELKAQHLCMPITHSGPEPHYFTVFQGDLKDFLRQFWHFGITL